MEFARRGPATAVADGDDSDLFRDPPPHVYSTLVIREALQAQLQKQRLRQEIIEAELAKIDHAMALRPVSLDCISLADLQQGKPLSSVTETEEFMPRRGYLSAVLYPNKRYERSGSSELKPWKQNTGYRPGECSSNGKACQESKLQESNGIKQPMQHSLTWELTEVTLPVKQPKAPERWSCTVCQVEATSEHNLQEHLVGQKHQSKLLGLNTHNGGTHLTTTHALQQEQRTAMDYVHLPPPSAGGKLPLSGSDGNVVSSEMARHMLSLCFCMVCRVQCSNEAMFEDHRRGKKRRGKVKKQKRMTFCQVCNLRCHTEQMFASHLNGKKHQKHARLMGPY